MAFGSVSRKHNRLWRTHYLRGVEHLQQAHRDYEAGRCWQATLRAHQGAVEAGYAVAHVESDRTEKRGARSMARGLESLAFSAQAAVARRCILPRSERGKRTSAESEFDWFAKQNPIDVPRLREVWGLPPEKARY